MLNSRSWGKKSIYKSSKLTSILKHVKISGILPFTEEPLRRKKSNESISKGGDGRIRASDPFSIFTANIIKEEVVFTR